MIRACGCADFEGDEVAAAAKRHCDCNRIDIADVITYVVAFAVVIVVLLASSVERRLVLGPDDSGGMTPTTDEDRERAAAMTWPRDGRIPA